MPFQPIAFPAARVVEKLAARRDRDMRRGRRGKQAALKTTVEWAFNRGTGDPLVRARYGNRAQDLHLCNIDLAIRRVERWFREERKKQRKEMAEGRGSRLSLEVLAELRLLLRLIRRSKLREHYPAIVQLVVGEADQVAAAVASGRAPSMEEVSAVLSERAP
jgi:hypothetical protein